MSSKYKIELSKFRIERVWFVSFLTIQINGLRIFGLDEINSLEKAYRKENQMCCNITIEQSSGVIFWIMTKEILFFSSIPASNLYLSRTLSPVA